MKPFYKIEYSFGTDIVDVEQNLIFCDLTKETAVQICNSLNTAYEKGYLLRILEEEQKQQTKYIQSVTETCAISGDRTRC